jgi:hypothetical protein
MVIGEDLSTEKGPEKNLAVTDNLQTHVANQWYIPCCSRDYYVRTPLSIRGLVCHRERELRRRASECFISLRFASGLQLPS